jgi:hypothetical protein
MGLFPSSLTMPSSPSTTKEGGFQWLVTFSGAGNEAASKLAVGADGSVVVAGEFDETTMVGDATFDAGEISQAYIIVLAL